eukprot:TRINITY_DN27515_c0_g1_i1.p1 TRINITY_DN27515_c0_g1~~TRINITY_DN27515_c0_g1_i1.p1  ORF type:complete len:472 (+),score=158.33 TRINITY_DN27515_c0_g1_i1:69-1484(+)
MDTLALLFERLLQLMVLSVCAFNVGRLFQQFLHVPCITGFILTGIVCGPYALALVSSDPSAFNDFKKIEQGALSVIGFAAGSELVLKDILPQGKAIVLVVLAVIVAVGCGVYTVTTTMLPGNRLFEEFTANEQQAACILLSTILIARSPASAIAVVKETRSTGSFTKLAVCASIVLDTCVVSLFSIAVNMAKMLVDGKDLTLASAGQPFVKLVMSCVVGYCLFRVLTVTLPFVLATERARDVPDRASLEVNATARRLISGLWVFVAGLLTFIASDSLRDEGTYVRIDPLLCCVACGACFSNSPLAKDIDFAHGIIDMTLPWTNIPFFTLVGCGMSFAALPYVVNLGAAILFVRVLGLVVGSGVGGYISSLPPKHHHVRWMAFITQAGVAIGLCKQASLEFPTFGGSLKSLGVSCILVNLLFGPIAFKWVLQYVGESGPADAPDLGRAIATQRSPSKMIARDGTMDFERGDD